MADARRRRLQRIMHSVTLYRGVPGRADDRCQPQLHVRLPQRCRLLGVRSITQAQSL